MDEKARIKQLEAKVAELTFQAQLDKAEIVRLRRWIERLEDNDEL